MRDISCCQPGKSCLSSFFFFGGAIQAWICVLWSFANSWIQVWSLSDVPQPPALHLHLSLASASAFRH